MTTCVLCDPARGCVRRAGCPQIEREAFARGAAVEHEVGHLGIPLEGCKECCSRSAVPQPVDREALLNGSEEKS